MPRASRILCAQDLARSSSCWGEALYRVGPALPDAQAGTPMPRASRRFHARFLERTMAGYADCRGAG